MTWEDKDDPHFCPICQYDTCVPAFGPKKSPILIIGEFPGEDEIKMGKPLVGRTGGVLRTELGRLGIDLNRMRKGNLWIHPPQKVKNVKAEIEQKDQCLKYSADLIIQEAKGRQVILLIGSDTVKFFCDQSVMSVSGLLVTSSYLSAPMIMAMVQPATVFHGGIGEVRLALKKFAEVAKPLL